MKLKLNLGSGPKLLPGYENVDLDAEGAVHQDIVEYLQQCKYASVDEVILSHILEHLPYEKETALFKELPRILAPGATVHIQVPDLAWVCEQFANAYESEFEWYQPGHHDHYFGGGRDMSKRWSFLLGCLYGNQSSPGQFHVNGYTEHKLTCIAKLTGLQLTRLEHRSYKGLQCLDATMMNL